MLKLNILKPVVIAGRVYEAGDSVEVNKTMLHYEDAQIPSALQVLLDADGIEAVSGEADTYKVIGDIVVNVVGMLYAKGEKFVYHKVLDYVDVIDYPTWIATGVTDGHWALDDGEIHVTGVTIDKATFSIDEGATLQLAPVVVPAGATDKTGVWASDNVAIATVNASGLVTAVKAGSCNVTFTSTDGAKVGTSAGTVTVAIIVPTSVTVSPASPTCAVGATVKMTAAITPANSTDKTGTWSSATPAVATVAADGTVTGVTAGTSVVSFTTNSGAKSANRTVTITA